LMKFIDSSTFEVSTLYGSDEQLWKSARTRSTVINLKNRI
jgi:hypothetical protein